ITPTPGFNMHSPEFLPMPLRHLVSLQKRGKIAWDERETTGGAAGRLLLNGIENYFNNKRLMFMGSLS
ncbi:MAG: hypothetical protein LT080_04225, partial [Thiobacillus sp.]|nr:hypothetical protein [Thiobacillus sp.]